MAAKPTMRDAAHRGEPAELARDRADLVGDAPRGGVVALGAGRARSHDEEADDDDDREDRGHHEVAAEVEVERADGELVVPADVDLEDAERDRGGGDGGQVGEAAEHERGERGEQDGHADG